MKGMLFNIQRYSIHDGPGIRTTVFLKGCNLACYWCHNVESQSPYAQIQYFKAKCTLCGKCIDVCPNGAHQIQNGEKVYLRDRCEACGACAAACPSGALATEGYEISAGEVLVEIEKDINFYKSSGGGVTFSGGEPMMQIKFLKELLTKCKSEAIHTAVDTAGHVPWELFGEILPYTDLFLFDIKTMDDKKHMEAVGAGNGLILSNIKRLSGQNAAIIVRIPVIPDFNDTKKDILEIADFVNRLPNISRVDLLPYNEMAGVKYESLGMKINVSKEEEQDKTEVSGYKNYFKANKK